MSIENTQALGMFYNIYVEPTLYGALAVKFLEKTAAFKTSQIFKSPNLQA